MAATAPPDIGFRPLATTDFPLLCRWLGEPHVRAFYQRTPASLEEVAAKHSPRVRGEVPTVCHLALRRGAPFAYLQCYRNADWPDWAEEIGHADGISIDLYIGEPTYVGRGFGRAMLAAYLRDIAFGLFDDDMAYIAHDVTNTAALTCSMAVGFQEIGAFVEDGVSMRLLSLRRGEILTP